MSKEKIAVHWCISHISRHIMRHTRRENQHGRWGGLQVRPFAYTAQMIWGPPSLSMCGVFLFVCKWRFDWGKKKSLGRDDSIVYVCIYILGGQSFSWFFCPSQFFPVSCPNWRWSLHHFFSPIPLAYPAPLSHILCNPSNTPNVRGMALIKTKIGTNSLLPAELHAQFLFPPLKFPADFLFFYYRCVTGVACVTTNILWELQ
jgi:hypothetical protein